MVAFCNHNNLEMVNVVEEGEAFSHTYESLQELSDSLRYDNAGKAEGIVVREKSNTYNEAACNVRFFYANR